MIISDIIINPSSKINAKVELYQGSTLVTTCTCNDRLQELTVERIGESNKFFGFGIIHKLNIMLIDLDRSLEITNDYSFKVSFGVNEDFVRPYPTFYISTVERDETTNTISIVAYDILNKLDDFTIADLNLNATYTYMNLASKCALKIGLNSVGKKGFVPEDKSFDTVISAANPANFDGTEKLRAIVTNIAEATQSIYYVDRGNSLNFRKLNKDEAAAFTVTKEDCYNLTSGEKVTLGAICHVTELGDNVIAGSGTTQYVRNNPLWELRTDLPTLLENAVLYNGGLTIDQFYCDWGGNFLLEPGDKINFVAEDNSLLTAYLLHDTIKFYGILEENTQWTYKDQDETAANPISLGERLKQTYAKVNKANKQIELVASETTENREAIASLVLTTSNISAQVENLEIQAGGDYTEFSQKLTALEVDLNGIEANVTAITQTTTDLEEDIEAVNNEFATIEGSITALDGRIATNTTAIGDLNISTAAITARVAATEEKATTLEGNITNINGDISDLSGRITTNTTAIGELNVTTNEISASVASLESSTTELSDSLADTDSKVETNTSDIASLKVTTEGITASVESLESTTESLTTKDGELEESITTNATAIGELQVSTEEISASVTALETTTDNLTEEVTTNKENIATLQITADGINATVSTLETNITSQLEGLDESVEILSKEVSTKVTAEDITVAIEEERKNGATHVTTSTGFTFDSDGLTITKSDSAISTNIDEDGLSVFKYNEEVLTADNTGVQAQNLHATTYLIIGNNTYFADFTGTDGRARAGCFWTGK